MKKIMFEIAGLALLCSACIGTVKAAGPADDGLELEDLGDSTAEKVDGAGEGTKSAKTINEKTNSQEESKVEKAETQKTEEPTKEETKEETQKTEEPTKEETKEEAQKTEEPTKEETKEETQKTEEPTKEETKEEPTKEETKEEAQKTEEPTKEETKEETQNKEESTKEETQNKEEPTKEETQNKEESTKEETQNKEESTKEETKEEALKEETSDTEKTNNKNIDKLAKGLAAMSATIDINKAIVDAGLEKNEEFKQQQGQDMAELFGNDSSEQISNEQSGAVLPSISEKDLGRNIANEFDEALKSYLEQQKKLSGLKKDLSDQYEKLSQELSKLPEGSETQSRITEIHKSLTKAEDDLGKLKTELSQLDKTWDEGQLDRSKFEEVWKNLDAQKKLLDDQVDVRSKLSNEIGQFASKLEGLKGTLTEIDKLLENFGVVKNALTEINKTDYSELFSVVNKQGPHKMLNEQQEWEKTRTLWKNHENGVIRTEAEETTEARKVARKVHDVVKNLSKIVEQARKELDVLELSKDDFTGSAILNGTDWSSYAEKFNTDKVNFPNSLKDLATKINKGLVNFEKLRDSINNQTDSIIPDKKQDEGIAITKDLMKLLSSFEKVNLTEGGVSLTDKDVLDAVEELLSQAGKIEATINVNKLKFAAFKKGIKGIPPMGSYADKLNAAKVEKDKEPLVEAVNGKLGELGKWISSTKDSQPTEKNEKGKELISKKDQLNGLKLVRELKKALIDLKNGLNEAIEKSKKAAEKAAKNAEKNAEKKAKKAAKSGETKKSQKTES